MNNYNTNVAECQVLHDKNARGRERPWARYKLLNGYYALAYDDINARKAERLRDCGTWLEFAIGDDGMKLHRANFCRVRLCPICAWRRSLKTYGQVRAIMAELGNKYAYIFLTLTVPNCTGDELSQAITDIGIGFNRLMKYKQVAKAVKGYYKGLEITHNMKSDMYHPHIHCIVAVNSSYFSGRTYIKHDTWLELWNRANKRSDITQVDVRRLHGNVEHACAEVAKYAVKPGDVVCFDDWDLTVDTIRTLDSALDKRRLVGYGGVFRDVHKSLHLDDVDDGDLVHVENLAAASDDEINTIAYAWHTGYCQYIQHG